MKSRFLRFLFFFFLIFFTLQILGVGKPGEEEKPAQSIEINAVYSSYNLGDTVAVAIKNNLTESIVIPQDYPNEPLDVYNYSDGQWHQLHSSNEEGVAVEIAISPGETKEISYADWKKDLFSNLGKYKIEFPIVISGEEKIFITEFEFVEPGFFKSLWNTLFYKPIYNCLIFFISILPENQNLALAIILLTLVIKLILLAPNNKAIRAQRDMQKVQPLLEEIKAKYAGNQQKIAEETMKAWKEHKVNPFGSCLPLLIQFPIMIALFYVVKDGLAIEENVHLLYSFLRDGILNIDPWFLGVLNLTEKNLYVLPLLVGGLQFLQMKMAFAKSNDSQKPVAKEQLQMQTMNKTMIYILPIMIAVFTASLPAAVGLYWGVSTLFAIGQQYYVNNRQ
jgi:YidC/Oxa1 family membrane protein insertase